MADKRLRTMVFPGLEDTYTIPQDMNDLESIEAVAEPYDEFSSYSIGDYCSNGGKLYRCNTAILSGETWNANHWTETNVGDEILAEKTATSTALSGKVSKDGDTMTGSLYINGTLGVRNYDINGDRTDTDVTIIPSSNKNWAVRFRDKNGFTVGAFTTVYSTGGSTNISIFARKIINGVNTDNTLIMTMNADGTRKITVTSPQAWLAALGLGSSGALPITIAQGGTGQTGIVSNNTISDILTAASGVTVGYARCTIWGKVAMLYVGMSKSTAISSETTVATLKTGFRPAYDAGLIIKSTKDSYGYMQNTGAVIVNGNFAANEAIPIYATYILAN